MAEETKSTTAADSGESKAKSSGDEVALELMKFIAITTGYGKGSGGSTGFGKTGGRSEEAYAESLLELYQRCRHAVAKPLV